MSNITNNIKAIMAEKGLKQRAVAEGAGLEYKKFNNLLNGRKTFDVMYVDPICKALGVTPNDLFRRGGG